MSSSITQRYRERENPGASRRGTSVQSIEDTVSTNISFSLCAMKLFTAFLVVVLAVTMAVDLGHASRQTSLFSRVFARDQASLASPRDSVQVNAGKLEHFLISTFTHGGGRRELATAGEDRGNVGVHAPDGPDLHVNMALSPSIVDVGPIASQRMYDVIILLDSSGSIGSDEFIKAKQFMANFVDQIPSTVGQDATRIACISFSEGDKIIQEFNFLDHTDKSSVIQAINQIQYQNGASTHTTKALRKAQALFASSGRSGAKRVLFVATDGRSNGGGNPAVPANEMKNSDRGDVQIEVAAVTRDVNDQEIDAIASTPPSEHVYKINTFTDANAAFDTVRENMARIKHFD